jgi:hypothetical protein
MRDPEPSGERADERCRVLWVNPSRCCIQALAIPSQRELGGLCLPARLPSVRGVQLHASEPDHAPQALPRAVALIAVRNVFARQIEAPGNLGRYEWHSIASEFCPGRRRGPDVIARHSITRRGGNYLSDIPRRHLARGSYHRGRAGAHQYHRTPSEPATTLPPPSKLRRS